MYGTSCTEMLSSNSKYVPYKRDNLSNTNFHMLSGNRLKSKE